MIYLKGKEQKIEKTIHFIASDSGKMICECKVQAGCKETPRRLQGDSKRFARLCPDPAFDSLLFEVERAESDQCGFWEVFHFSKSAVEYEWSLKVIYRDSFSDSNSIVESDRLCSESECSSIRVYSKSMKRPPQKQTAKVSKQSPSRVWRTFRSPLVVHSEPQSAGVRLDTAKFTIRRKFTISRNEVCGRTTKLFMSI